MKSVSIIVASFLLLSSTVMAGSEKPGFRAGQMAENAPPELMHWGQLVGQWTTTEEQLKPDGSGWIAAGDADWDFFWSYDGWGIQDDYRSPGSGTKLDDESKRQRGTNLRIYNADENKWILTWLTTASKEPTFFTATSTMEEVVMLSTKVDARGNHSRITFFDLSDTHFEWKLEWSADQDSWREVYRIHGTKLKD